ncbi:hypothetical protein LPJ64_002892, partial [Coemansia asiatica]
MQNRRIPQLTAALLYVVAGAVFFFTKHFYQIVIFRVVLGFASSIADTMLFTTVADVYPASLLGFKMAILFVFDNIGNMVGPIFGGKAYESMGVGGIGIIAMALGVVEIIMILVFVRNSLDIRQTVAKTVSLSPTTCSLDALDFESANALQIQKSNNLKQDKLDQCNNNSSTDILSCTKSTPSMESLKSTNKDVQMWRLLLKLQVLGPTVSIFVATGMQSVIETVLPLRLYDKFGYSPETIGVAFLIVGGILILSMPLVGYINDLAVSRYGEHMRYYTIAAGAFLTLISLIVTAVAGNYSVLVFGYAMFGIMSMIVIVPAQSAFGDFINSTDSDAMAQSFSLAWFAEGLANIALPP